MYGPSIARSIEVQIQNFSEVHPSSEAAEKPAVCEDALEKLNVLKTTVAQLFRTEELCRLTVTDAPDSMGNIIGDYLGGALIGGCIQRMRSLLDASDTDAVQHAPAM